jgi:hypothetical protein
MKPDRRIIVASESGISLKSSDDIADAISAGIEAHGLVLVEADLGREFFALRTGLLGELFQKCINYRIRLAIVIADPKAYGERFTELAREHSTHGLIRFFGSKEDAMRWLTG